MTLFLILFFGWLATSATAITLWCALSWFYGTGKDNRPAVLARQRAHEQARRDFVTTSMSRAA